MKKINNTKKREIRNRKKLKDVAVNRLRISVFKSLKNISAQIIDDKLKKTLVSVSSIEKEIKSNKMKTKSLGLGDDLEKVFKKTGIKAIVDKVTKGGCGCKERKDALNRAFPYSNSK